MKARFVTLFLLIFSTASFTQTYDLKSWVIDDGGVVRMTSSGYIMGASVSQSFIGKLTNSNYIAHIGYWTPKNAPPGIREDVHFSQPIVFGLNQNYPNPGYSKTVIKYSIPKVCKVELKLYDVTGRQVAVLVNENQEPGYYKVNWNIRNVSENQLPNGVYFYQLKAGDFTETKKMIVLR